MTLAVGVCAYPADDELLYDGLYRRSFRNAPTSGARPTLAYPLCDGG